MFCKVNGKRVDFSGLKAYLRGPVFSATYGDRRHDTNDFFRTIKK